jgi:sulfonate transport system substrate-binding protein
MSDTSFRLPAISRRTTLATMGALLLSGTRAFAAETPPAVIRIGGVGYGYGKQFGQNAIAIAQANKLIEQELKGTTQVEYHFYDHTGPAINEALAGGQLDFAAYGELPQIIGKANGIPTRVIANGGISNIYVAVRNGVKAQTVADLKGLRVTIQRGTILHQALDRILAENGLSEKDIQLYDLPTADQLTALTNGQADASVGVASILTLRDQGIVRIIYSTAGRITPDGINVFSVLDNFATKYPAATAAVVRGFVKASYWSAQPANRQAALEIWSRSGTPLKVLNEDFTTPLKEAQIPLIDDLFVAGLKVGVNFSLQNKLIRQPVDVDAWIDRRYLDAALKDLDLVSYWQPRHAPPALAAQ